MEKWTSSISGLTEHLEPEVLAAFLDGQLSEDENRRVRQHLAECEDCDQVFVATVDFLNEEEEEERRKADDQGKVHPFARPGSRADRGSWRWRIAVAATVVLAVGAGSLGYRAFEAPAIDPSGMEVQALPAPDADRAGSSELPDEVAALTLGTQLQALAASVALGADTSKLVEHMVSVVNRTPSLRQLRADLNEPDAADRLLKADLRGKLDTPQWFDVGELAAVGRAAARAQQEDPLRGSWDGFQFGRRLSRLLREKSGKLTPKALGHLGKIEKLREARELDFVALEEEFDALLEAPDPTASLRGPL